MKYDNSILTCRYPKLGLKWYISGKEPLSFSCEIILQAFVCSLTVELYDISCPGSGKVQLKNSTKFHVHEVGSFSSRTLPYFMSTKWKSLTGEIYYISHGQKWEKFNGRDLRYFMSTKWKSLTGESCDNSCPTCRTNCRTSRYFMSTKWESLTVEFYDISCQWSGKV